ncbi:MAG: transketolase [Bacteroidaceae bacterium]|nr:transketolase [Bacteroidaceae bacterium]
MDISKECLAMKLKALEMALSTGSNGSHIGGAFSAMEILAALYSVANAKDMNSEERDRIIISKGHSVLALFTVLWQHGFITEEELLTFDTNGTKLHGHPHRCLERGIEFSGGSLGLGISYAVGVALACKIKGFNNKIYVLVGDGECDEGIVWESLMAIAHHKLNNVVVIVDRNKWQLDGPVAEIMDNASLEAKFAAFGFNVDVVDGHSIDQLLDCYNKKCEGPRAIIADTVKANGISFLVNNKKSHFCAITRKQYDATVEEIKNAYGC